MIADNEENGEGSSTLALIDESYMKVLYTAWTDFAYANEPALLGENYSMHVRGGRRAHPILREKGLFDFLFDEDGDYSMSDYYITDIMAVAQNIESKETEALAAAVNLSICYFNCTDDEVGMTGLSVTLPYGDSEFYGYLYPVFTGVGMDADYVGWLEKFVYAEGYNDYYDYESWYEDDWEAGTIMKTTGTGLTGCSLRMTTIGRMTAGTNGEAISPGQDLETAGQIA